MLKIRVVIYGLGGVGKELVAAVSKSENIELAGGIARNPKVIGKDLGIYCGLEKPLGISITDDKIKETALYEKEKIDVVIDCTSAKDAVSTYEGMRSAILHGINVIVASASVTDLWVTHPKLAEKIDSECKKYKVVYFGTGSVQVVDRMVVAMTEGSMDIQNIEYTHHADVHAFPEISNRQMLGFGLTREEYINKFETNNHKEEKDVSMRKESVVYVCAQLGWKLDNVTRDIEIMTDERGIVYGTKEVVQGWRDGKVRMTSNWIFLYDSEQKYYDRVIIRGTPEVDAVVSYSPDRGMCTTAGTIKNSIRRLRELPPGYKSHFDLPCCGWTEQY